MPYAKKEDLPEAVKGLPDHGQEIWMAAYNSAAEQYAGDEEKCMATAWAAVKNKYEKNADGKWVAKGGDHADPDLGWVPVFRIGEHTDSEGNTRKWSEADLDLIASSYDPSKHEAPVVIGHPITDAPAWGWVEGLRREGLVLSAKLKNLVPEFVDMVKKGMFKKRSISLYPDLTLRHIGFLGAMPPSVKGLADIKFDEGLITLEYEESNNKNKGGAKMGLRDILKGIFTKAIDEIPEDQLLTAQPRVFSEAEVKERERLAAERATKDFSEKEKGLRDREAILIVGETGARRKILSDLCEGLLQAGKLMPGMTKPGMGMVSFLEAVAGIPAEIEFEEGGQKKKQKPLDFAKSFLEGLPKVIEFSEVAGRGKQPPTDFDKLVDARMADKKCSRAEAISFVAKDNPEAHKEYIQQINQK